MTTLEAAARAWLEAWRQLRRRPWPTATVVVTLAVGIAVFASVMALVDAVLLDPLPYREPDGLAAVVQHWGDAKEGAQSLSPAEFLDYEERLAAFESFGVYGTGWANLAGDGEPQRVPVAHLSAGAWRAFGVNAVLGRAFTPDDDHPGVDDVAMLSDGLWRQWFGGAAAAVGRRVLVDGRSVLIVGVLPPSFRLPDEMATSTPAGLYLPLALTRERVTIRGGHVLSSVGRLKTGMTLAMANAQVDAAARSFIERFPANYPASFRFGARARSVRDVVIGDARPVLLMLLGAAACVLLIACVNAGGLLVAQSQARRHETAVRLALGGTRKGGLRQLLLENAFVAACAGALGLFGAWLVVRSVARAEAITLPRLSALTLNGKVVVAAVLVTVACGIACGMLPALELLRIDVSEALRSGGRGSDGHGRARVRRVLVAAEIGTSVVLLLGTVLLAKSLQRLLDVDPGFRVDGVWTVPVSLPAASYPTSESTVQFFQRLDERARAIPGVRAVGAVAGLPLVAPRGELGIDIEDHPSASTGERPTAAWQVVTPGYFSAIGMRLQRGRVLTPFDVENAPGAVVINETMARRYWPGVEAVGRRFRLRAGARPETVTVVGVTADVRQSALSEPPTPEMYLAHAQFRIWGTGLALSSMTLVLGSSGQNPGVPAGVRAALHELSPTLPAGAARTMAEVRATSLARPRVLLELLAAAAALAVLTAVVGLYAVVAHSVAQRTREFGVRSALGAQGRDLTRLVLRESAMLALAGLAVGGPVALAFVRILRSMLFGVASTDPTAFVTVLAGLAAVSMLAAYVPARHASAVDPAAAQRAE